MRSITRVALLFYRVMILAVVAFSIGLSLHLISLQSVNLIAQMVYNDHQLRIIVGIIAVLIFLMDLLFNGAISGKEFREKNIAFDNPAGRVTVSLTAMEDLIRQVISRMNEVKDVRASWIKATKRGLDVRVNLALHSDVSIPEFTAQLQEIVKRKILDTIGLEGTVVVRVDVTKIVGEDRKSSKDKIKAADDFDSTTVPFQGYRA